jgi:hypothetical protein
MSLGATLSGRDLALEATDEVVELADFSDRVLR